MITLPEVAKTIDCRGKANVPKGSTGNTSPGCLTNSPAIVIITI